MFTLNVRMEGGKKNLWDFSCMAVRSRCFSSEIADLNRVSDTRQSRTEW